MDTTMELILVNVAEEDGIVIRYFLYGDECENRQSYSLECRCGEESVLLSDITSLRERAEEIFDLFVRGRVTPISARDVIEEILS